MTDRHADPMTDGDQPLTSTDASLVQPESSSVEEFRVLFNPDLDFRKLAEAGLTEYAQGFRLVNKKALLGVPHIIINITYREGFLNKDTKIRGDYVSLEAVVANDEFLRSPIVRAMTGHRELEVFGNETIVYNDGGTGIRRSITEMLVRQGLINPGGKPNDNRRFDRPMSQWVNGAELAAEGIRADKQGEHLRYGVIRGLRRSDYLWEGQDATTYYFA